MHFAEEFDRDISCSEKSSSRNCAVRTWTHYCVGNDLGFDEIFSRGIEAFGRPGDIAVLLTTSGNSSNLVKAADRAKQQGLKIIAFLGKTGGRLRGKCDLEWTVPGFGYSDRIQEAHMAAMHIMIEIVEKILFSSSLL